MIASWQRWQLLLFLVLVDVPTIQSFSFPSKHYTRSISIHPIIASATQLPPQPFRFSSKSSCAIRRPYHFAQKDQDNGTAILENDVVNSNFGNHSLLYKNENSNNHEFTVPESSTSLSNQLMQQSIVPSKEIKFPMVLLLLIVVLFIVPALAVDHPVDYVHLKITSPIPNGAADPRYFLSGGLCAAASHGITTPIDVIKTRIQSEPETFQNQGFLQATTTIIAHQDDDKNGGIKSLLKGLGPTLVGYGIEGAAKFGLYESLKPTILQWFDGIDNPTLPYVLASVVAGAVASLILCPMERTRIRLVTDRTFAPGFIAGIGRLIEESGFQKGLFSGVSAMLSKQIPYTAAKQVSFDAFAAFLYANAAKANWFASMTKLEVSFIAAFLASIVACILSQPGDVVVTQTYKNPKEIPSFVEVVSTIYKSQGIQGFFVGVSARFFHVGGIIVSQLVLYDIIKQILGLPPTGT